MNESEHFKQLASFNSKRLEIEWHATNHWNIHITNKPHNSKEAASQLGILDKEINFMDQELDDLSTAMSTTFAFMRRGSYLREKEHKHEIELAKLQEAAYQHQLQEAEKAVIERNAELVERAKIMNARKGVKNE